MKRADGSPRMNSKGTSLKASTIHKQRLLTTPTSVFKEFLRTHYRLHALTSSRKEIFAILNAQINTTASALHSPRPFQLVFMQRRIKNSRPPCGLFCVPRRNEVDRRQFWNNGDRYGFLVSTKKLKCALHVVSSHGTGAMSLWYETKTRYERSVRMEEARRARLSAACFGRRLTMGLSCIEPTAR